MPEYPILIGPPGSATEAVLAEHANARVTRTLLRLSGSSTVCPQESRRCATLSEDELAALMQLSLWKVTPPQMLVSGQEYD